MKNIKINTTNFNSAANLDAELPNYFMPNFKYTKNVKGDLQIEFPTIKNKGKKTSNKQELYIKSEIISHEPSKFAKIMKLDGIT